jgi:hypothetical protein
VALSASHLNIMVRDADGMHWKCQIMRGIEPHEAGMWWWVCAVCGYEHLIIWNFVMPEGLPQYVVEPECSVCHCDTRVSFGGTLPHRVWKPGDVWL